MDLKNMIKTRLSGDTKIMAKKRGRKTKRSMNHRLKTDYQEFQYGMMVKIFKDIPDECVVEEGDEGKMCFVAGNRQNQSKIWRVEYNGVTVIVDGSYRTYPSNSVIIDRSNMGVRISETKIEDPYREAVRKMSDTAHKNLSRRKKPVVKKSKIEKIDDQLTESNFGNHLKSQIKKTVKRKK